MTSSVTVPAPTEPETFTVPVEGRVRTPSGRTLSAAAARRIALATPANTRRSRRSRTGAYDAWCRAHGRIGTDPGTVPDWAAHLAELGHPAETIAAYTTPVLQVLEVSGHPLDAEDRSYLRAIINHRSAEEATDPDGAGDALQAAECTREDLAAMVATLDVATVCGRRNALTLTLDWYMAGRASEPAALNLRDVREVVAELVDPDSGEPLHLPALEVTVRRSKTNPYGRTTDVVRIVAQGDVTCPVAAYRAWLADLTAAGVDTGPLLRRVDRRDRLTTAGRPPADPRRAGGIGDRTVRNLIRDAAAAAGLTRELTEQERALLSTAVELAHLGAVEDAAEAERIRAEWRRRRRALRRSLRRYAGHSMRRGQVRHMQRQGIPRHIIEMHARYVPGSRALARYLEDLVAWKDNPTVPRRERSA